MVMWSVFKYGGHWRSGVSQVLCDVECNVKNVVKCGGQWQTWNLEVSDGGVVAIMKRGIVTLPNPVHYFRCCLVWRNLVRPTDRSNKRRACNSKCLFLLVSLWALCEFGCMS